MRRNFMPATLTIEVSDELWECLRQAAVREDKTPEVVAAEYLAYLTPKLPAGAVRRWAGAWASNVPDASLRHDDYLGEALHQQLGEPHD
jgi:hypothetical protein